ncbi:MAG TPA: hypothetical protein VF411_12545 [Bacteroidia bacterium]
MKTITQAIKTKQFLLLLFILLTPLLTFAEAAMSVKEEAEAKTRMDLLIEIAVGVFFVAAVTAFLIYKSKHEKKESAKQIEILKRVQASKKRAA